MENENNIFTEIENRKTPNSIEECKTNDLLTTNLCRWSERVNNIGIIVAILIAFAALVIGIYMADDWYEPSAFFICLLIGVVIAFFEYLTFRVIALLIGSLASIVQSNKIASNIALYNCSKSENFNNAKE
ncbi:MAG: hypothetical protein U0L33_04810 [Acutalibacteraceae bacterium]|nr:hypothetical protein [Acutalibacteraceae bacterium]